MTPNSNYPSIASMYTVYLGLQNKASIDNTGTYSAPTVKMSVAKVVVVILFTILVNTKDFDFTTVVLS